ncbi:MAG: SPFH domain-containing protein [Methylotenera sp.]|nr:SPFH domain-containing protein [Oligoflexia bacterium]
MGIFNFVKKQFIDVIDWVESGEGVLAFRYPVEDREIQNGAQLTVRDTQLALFVNEGEVADAFTPGRYSLTTQTLPLMTSLKNWDKLFQSPFKSDVFFFSTRTQIDQKWGTGTPITIRDKEFGPIRIRAYGTFAFKIKNPQTFFKTLSGTRDVYTTEELEGQLRSTVLTSMASFFGGADVGFVDMAANQTKFSDTLKTALAPAFAAYGLSLENFYVQSVSLPEELEKHLDVGSSMRMVGDLQKYAQFQTAEAIGTAASHGGDASSGVGMGAGLAMGQVMANSLSNSMSGSGNRQGSESAPAEDPVVLIGKLHQLLTQGVLTQAEFDAKKAELLKKIT